MDADEQETKEVYSIKMCLKRCVGHVHDQGM
jgi:hypothetical protein